MCILTNHQSEPNAPGYNKGSNRATRELFPKNGVQQGQIQETEGGKVSDRTRAVHAHSDVSHRYSKSFETIEPTIYNICEYWFKKDQNRIRDIRPDSLSQMLNLANVRPGGRYIVVDDASGLLVSAVLDRIGCKWTLLQFAKAY